MPRPSDNQNSIRPLHSEDDYRWALSEIEALFEAEAGTPECDRLEVLATLVEAYELQHHPIPPPDPIEALRYHLESRGLPEAALEPYLGDGARVADVLNRREPLTIEMIRKLRDGLGLSADILIQPYPLLQRAA